MKCLHISSTDAEGGAARAAYRLHCGLREIGMESVMLVQSKKTADPYITGPVTTFGRGMGKVRPYIDRAPLKLYPERQDTPWSINWLPGITGSKIRKPETDIVNLHWICDGFVPISLIKRLEKPLVWTLHDSWPFTGGCHIPYECKGYRDKCGACPQLGSYSKLDLSRIIWMWKSKVLNRQNITIAAPSSWLAQCVRQSSLFNRSRVAVIPNGLDMRVYKPADRLAVRNMMGLPAHKKIIAFGANNALNDMNKGFDRFCATISMAVGKDAIGKELAENYEVLIFGASEPLNGQKPCIKTHYLGRLKDDLSLVIAYSSADVMVVPSRQEAFGQTALEAMACGTPVAAFGCTGLLDIVDHMKNGFLAECYNIKSLAEGILWILDNEDRWRRLSEEARIKAVARFDILNVSKQYEELYRSLLQ